MSPARGAGAGAPAGIRLALPLVLLLCATLAAFAPSLGNGFTDWDDPEYLLENPSTAALTIANLGRIFSSDTIGSYIPLTILTYAVERHFFGLDPRVFHATNLLLHLANAALALWLFHRLTGRAWLAAAAALFFAVHPLRAEPVAWVCGRKDLLCTLFSLAACLAWLEARPDRARERRWLALALALFTLAIFSKVSALVLPAFFVAADLALFRTTPRASLRRVWPCALLAAALFVVTLAARQNYQGVLRETEISAASVAAEAAYRLWHTYLLRSLLPGLPGYPPYLPDGRVWQVAASLAGIALFAALVSLLGRRERAAPWCAAAFLLAIGPGLLTPVLGYAADRVAYLPSIPLGLLVALALSRLAATILPRPPRAAAAARVAALAGFCALLVPLTRERCRVWAGPVSLWSDAVTLYRSPGAGVTNLVMALNKRAGALAAAGDADSALRDLDEALRLAPGSTAALVSRGQVRIDRGEYAAAAADFGDALAVAPDNAAARLGRGIALAGGGDCAGSVAEFSAFVVLEPAAPQGYFNRGISQLCLDRPVEARRDFERALAIAPGECAPRVGLGLVAERLGLTGEAIGHLEAAIRADGRCGSAHYERGRILVAQGRRDEGLADLARSRELGYTPPAAPGGGAAATPP